MDIAAEGAGPTSGHPSRLPVISICIAVAVIALNTTAVGVATRGMADELGVSLDELGWIMGSYLITAAAFALIGGRLGDVIGRVRTYAIGLGIFAAGCAIAALAPDSVVLVAGRAIQGLGAAFVMPATIDLVVAFAGERGPSSGFRTRGVVYACSFGVGPLVGGLLTDYVSWRAVFWCELVLMAVAALVALSFRHRPRPEATATTRDFGGAILAALTIGWVVVGAFHVQTWGWSWPTAVYLVVSLLLLGLLWFVETRVEHPLVHPSLLRDPTVLGANLATLAASIGMLGLLYFFNVFAQSAAAFDYSALGVAFALGAFTLSIIVFALLAGFLSKRLGFRGPVVVGLGLSIAGFVWLARTTIGTTEEQLVVPLAICGVGAGIANAGLTAPAVMTRRSARVQEAAGLTTLARFFGSAMAVLVGTATYLTVAVGRHAGELAVSGEDPAEIPVGGSTFDRALATLEQDLRAPFEAAARNGTVEAFAETMRITAIVLFVLTVASTWLLTRAGRRVPGPTVPGPTVPGPTVPGPIVPGPPVAGRGRDRGRSW